ncbi:hypothetical protein FisN_4Hh428 [Fistulifera solaris]|uniref:Uncharacterized protein n=1 Tax=Fistulifera solaris TaxID=1519565 RepID=A0A1Z5KJD4_FISSO|nr:hypothetical protein FisN_4Hh428 [Fistulifera solaris]|eukprot:GAX26068.1 hypothetical protein FisN_4Hh428 [Fistulifera solaris]
MESASKKTIDKSSNEHQRNDTSDHGQVEESAKAPVTSNAMMPQFFFPFPFFMPLGYPIQNNAANAQPTTPNVPGLSVTPSVFNPLKVPAKKKQKKGTADADDGNAEPATQDANAQTNTGAADTQPSILNLPGLSIAARDLVPFKVPFGKERKAKKAAAAARAPTPKKTTKSARQPKPKEKTPVSAKKPKAKADAVRQPKPKKTAVSARKRKSKKVNEKDELVCFHPVHLKPDQLAGLEHVIRTGWDFKCKNQRIQDYLSTERNRAKVTRGDTTRTAKADGLHLHREDCRLYTTRYGFENEPWPRLPGKASKSKKGFLPDDTLWDQEHGDGIHPLAFESLRLSALIPGTKKQKDELQKWSSLELSGTVDVLSDDVPQLLLSRAWERAVHAAASTFLPSSFQRNFRTENITRSATLTRYRCSRLGIKMANGDDPLKCSCCKLVFKETTSLEAHFFGIRTTCGCAWRLIEAKEREMINSILRTESRSQIDTLFQRVAMSVRQKRESNGALDSSELLNWQDILDILRVTVDDSQASVQQDSIPQSLNPLLDSIQISSEEPPLLMNHVLLRTIEARLHDRYANVEGKPL